ncbi:MAG: FIST C-terminal domain-containing protein [Ignavibacteriae bacterium]|nr:FIST C-terminal domain-containing protein [Ignavibacteriota bacterium]
MKTAQIKYENNKWNLQQDSVCNFIADLAIIFGSRKLFQNENILKKIEGIGKGTIIAGCTTSGEITGTSVTEDTITVTLIKFEKTNIVQKFERIGETSKSFETGRKLMEQFDPKGLKHVLVLSDGLKVNGSKLVEGFREVFKKDVSITGGLAGDGTLFKETYVLNNSMKAVSGIVTAVGFYGENIRIGYGSLGGWDTFGIERLITKSDDNVLYELDGVPALELYKSFLGEQAQFLPAAGMLFPLSVRTKADSSPVVRTILGINEENQSLIFAGDMPQGSYARLMKANVDRLIMGAEGAAKAGMKIFKDVSPKLAILISCVGRKLVLKQIVEEEIESVESVIGGNTAITGFYSYGEISPFISDSACMLHNQTMTVTLINEN